MSHRSVLGTIDEQGNFTGRYIHSGGSPSNQVRSIVDWLAHYDGHLGAALADFERYGAHSSLGDPDEGTAEDQDGWIREGTVGQVGDVEEWGYFFTTRDLATAELVLVEEIDGHYATPGVLVERGRIPAAELLFIDDRAVRDIECGPELERCSHVAAVHFDDLPASARRLGTRKYLGYEDLEPQDAVAAIHQGVRVTFTGSGFSGGVELGWKKYPGRKGIWYQYAKTASGREVHVPIYSQRTGKAYAGTTLIYPELAR